MRALRLTRARLSAVQLCCLTLCLVAVWVLLASMQKSGFESLPLVWYLVLVLGPVVAVACFVASVRVRAGSPAWIAVGALVLVPQVFVWCFAVTGVLHYLGWIE